MEWTQVCSVFVFPHHLPSEMGPEKASKQRSLERVPQRLSQLGHRPAETASQLPTQLGLQIFRQAKKKTDHYSSVALFPFLPCEHWAVGGDVKIQIHL
jgi:hypothetical protein